MLIAHNMMASNAMRQFKISGDNKKKATEKLTSGYRINRASDDAAGLSISEKMRGQIRGLTQGVRNIEDGISLCQVADGALSEITSMLQRITELSVQSANDTNTTEDRLAIQDEVSQLLIEIDRVSDNTEFNSKPIFSNDSLIDLYTSCSLLSNDEITRRLIDGTFPPIEEDILQDDINEVLPKETANTILSELREFAILDTIYTHNYNIQANSDILEPLFNTLHDIEFQKLLDDDTIENSRKERYINLFNSSLEKAHDGFVTKDTTKFAKIINGAAHNVLYENSSYQNGVMSKLSIYFASKDKGDLVMALNYSVQATISGVSSDSNFGRDPKPGELNALRFNMSPMRGISDGIYRSKMDTACNIFRYMYGNILQENIKNPEGSWIQYGANSDQGLQIIFDKVGTTQLGINGLNVTSRESASNAISLSQQAIQKVTESRSKIGAYQNRLEHIVDNENNMIENTQVAESRIRDSDMAKEMVDLAKQQILEQIGTSMITQANQNTQGILKLLQ